MRRIRSTTLTAGAYESQGTIAVKASSGCGDLNLAYSYNAGSRTYDHYTPAVTRSRPAG
ncbi:hypothetical protein [Streptomyces sp. NPDC056361]|uniref:hypothetical protein n=1 Tax=Streptomyces sp. NPDC056361 TaxID=3345795 RepID=UPI0035E0B716